MKQELVEGFNSLVRLARFVAWYAIALGVLFYAAPAAASWLEGAYESMSLLARFSAVLVFIGAVGLWQYISMQRREQRALKKDWPEDIAKN